MRQLTLIEPGVVRWLDVPEPQLQAPDDALVRPVAVTTCDIDAPTIQGRTPFPPPIALGHEFVAEIVELGEQVEGFHRGQLVVVSFPIACGECDRCHAGITSSCRSVPPRSQFGFGVIGGDWGGALSDLVRVPFARHMLVPVPRGVSPHAIASASDNLPDAYRTVAPHLAESPGASVLVVGGMGNSIALYAVQIACALGASRVDFLDAEPARRELARSFGANALEGPASGSAVGEYQITVDASADPAGLASALRSVAPWGACTSIGIYFMETTPVPLLEMYARGVRFYTGRVNARRDIPHVLDLVQGGRIHPELVTSEIVAWEDAAKALSNPSLKPVIVREPQFRQ